MSEIYELPSISWVLHRCKSVQNTEDEEKCLCERFTSWKWKCCPGIRSKYSPTASRSRKWHHRGREYRRVPVENLALVWKFCPMPVLKCPVSSQGKSCVTSWRESVLVLQESRIRDRSVDIRRSARWRDWKKGFRMLSCQRKSLAVYQTVHGGWVLCGKTWLRVFGLRIDVCHGQKILEKEEFIGTFIDVLGMYFSALHHSELHYWNERSRLNPHGVLFYFVEDKVQSWSHH